MAIPFERFIERHYRGLNFISIPTAAHVPGVVLNNNDRVETALHRLFPNQPTSKWKTRTVDADMHNESVQGSRGLDLDFKLLGIFGIQGSVSANYEISFQFSEVASMAFDTDNGAVFENDIRTLIMGLKASDRSSWKQILHEFVVTEAVIVKKATFTIRRNGQAVVETNFPTHAGEMSIEGQFRWEADGTMVVENNRNVPFGLLGFQVKRNM